MVLNAAALFYLFSRRAETAFPTKLVIKRQILLFTHSVNWSIIMPQLIQWHEDAAGPKSSFYPEMTDVSSYLYPTTLSLADRLAVRPFFDICLKSAAYVAAIRSGGRKMFPRLDKQGKS
jgi:hypothetical protein